MKTLLIILLIATPAFGEWNTYDSALSFERFEHKWYLFDADSDETNVVLYSIGYDRILSANFMCLMEEDTGKRHWIILGKEIDNTELSTQTIIVYRYATEDEVKRFTLK